MMKILSSRHLLKRKCPLPMKQPLCAFQSSSFHTPKKNLTQIYSHSSFPSKSLSNHTSNTFKNRSLNSSSTNLLPRFAPSRHLQLQPIIIAKQTHQSFSGISIHPKINTLNHRLESSKTLQSNRFSILSQYLRKHPCSKIAQVIQTDQTRSFSSPKKKRAQEDIEEVIGIEIPPNKRPYVFGGLLLFSIFILIVAISRHRGEEDKPEEEIEFIYKVKEINQGNSDAESKNQEYTVKIGVGDHYGWVLIPEFKKFVLYNFNKEVITEVDMENNTSEERPMIADVAMRHEELLHQLELNQQTEIRLNLAELETNLHIPIPENLKKVFGVRGISSEVIPKFLDNPDAREVTFLLEDGLKEISRTLTSPQHASTPAYDLEDATTPKTMFSRIFKSIKKKTDSEEEEEAENMVPAARYGAVQKLTRTHLSMFNKILLYHFDLHPVVYDDIVSQTSKGNYLNLVVSQTRDWFGSKIATFELEHVRRRMSDLLTFKTLNSDVPPGFQKIYGVNLSEDEKGFLDRVESTLKWGNRPDIFKLSQNTDQDIQQSLGKGQFFDAFLSAYEFKLKTGLNLPSQDTLEREFKGKDNRIEKFLTNANSLTPQDLQGLSKPHLIKVKQAIQLDPHTQLEKSQNLLKQVVFQDPSLVNVVKEIGNNYFVNYEMDNAWLWWGVAKKLRKVDGIPLSEGLKDPLLRSVFEIEVKMKEIHPKFFTQKVD